ncbi:MAG: hypothetical protein ABIJ03_03155 [Patescibacteria group bacterium]|nr:hypothetical protein [Patescibacteria group bacterium]
MTNQISSQLKQLQHRNTLIIILVLLFISIFIWTGVSIISSTTTSQLPDNIKKLATPLNPSIDRQILGEIENKQVLSQKDLESFPIYKLILDRRTNTERVITIDMDESIFDQPVASTPTPIANPTLIPDAPVPLVPTTTPANIDSSTSTPSPAPNQAESSNE